MYAKRFIGPGTAFTIAILYWLNWAVALASEFTAAGLLMQRWFPHSPSWVWSAVFIVVVFAHGMVAGQGAADSRAIRQDEFPCVPVWAVLFSMAGSLLALLSSVLAASTV